MTEQIGRVLGGRYRLVAPIGTGSSASVYQADDVTLRRRVAVKVLHPGLAADEAFLRRFRAEARAAAALSHPNLMAVYDWGEDDGPYLVLELLGGGSLRALLDNGDRLTPAQAVLVGLEAARALDAAHRRGFVHRDIKPANLLFGDDGRLRIADFGLARALSEAAWTEPGDSLVGTARYAAPEQGHGSRVDGKADVYALALVLVEAVTGEVPLTRDSALGTLTYRTDAAIPVPEALGPLAPAIELAGRPDPESRPDAGAFGRALMAAARHLDRPGPLPLPGLPHGDAAVPAGAPPVDPTLLPAGGGGDRTVRVFDDLAVEHDEPVVVPDRPEPTKGRKPRSKLRRRWRWIVPLALLAVAAVAAAAVAWTASRPPTADVPDVDSMPVAQAVAALEEAQAASEEPLEWEVVQQGEFSETVALDSVIRQEPTAGSSLEDGGTVTLIVSQGPPPVELPALEGLTELEAMRALEDADFEVNVVRQPDEVVPRDVVVTWGTPAGDRPADLPKGSTVDLVVSDGPALRLVPDLSGEGFEAVKAHFEGMGLVVARTDRHSSEVDEGLVISTEPAPGLTAERGSTITVAVSIGPDLVLVPDVQGLTLDQAVQTLRDAGLEPDQVFGPAAGSPFTTDPAGGAEVERGTSVDIYLR
jgi:serine/threonine-protein kinase